MRSTHILLHGILPYFNIDYFVRWHTSHSVTSFKTESLMCGTKNIGKSLPPIQTLMKEICVIPFHNLLLEKM